MTNNPAPECALCGDTKEIPLVTASFKRDAMKPCPDCAMPTGIPDRENLLISEEHAKRIKEAPFTLSGPLIFPDCLVLIDRFPIHFYAALCNKRLMRDELESNLHCP